MVKSKFFKYFINKNILTTRTICEHEHPDSINALVTRTPCKHELSYNMNNLKTLTTWQHKHRLTWPTCCWRGGYEMRPAPPGERITAEGGSGQSPRSQTGSRGRWSWYWRRWWCSWGLSWSGVGDPPISFSPSFFSKACWKPGIKMCCRIYSETRLMQ